MTRKRERKGRSGQADMADSPVSPGHYRLHGAECIDVIRDSLSHEEFTGFLKGNVIKYNYRAGHKGDAEVDYGKALWYQRELHAAAAAEKWRAEHRSAETERAE